MAPVRSMRPIFPADSSVNQSAPSGPLTISTGWAYSDGSANLVIVPEGVIRSMALPFTSATQMLPSRPSAIPRGSDVSPSGHSFSTPFRSIRPTTPRASVNHIAPSDPSTISTGALC